MAHIKFLRYGTGSAKQAIQYLTGPKEGRKETVLRGDPELVAMVADSLATRYRYSSAVIAFAKEDAPTPEQIDHCLDDFRRAMGLEEDRLPWTAIRHDEPGDRVALHILVARVDLFTGKSYNPAPPGWQKRYDPLRDAWNYENGWARPDDPQRARLLQPGHQAFIEAANLKKGIESADEPKKLITEFLTQRIEAGLVNDRSGIINSLKEAGFEINRQGQDYLSVKDNESGVKIRLKGVIYGADFSTEELERSCESPEGKKGERSPPDPARGRECRLEFEKQLKRVCEYNKIRYRSKSDKELDTNLGLDFGGNADPGRSPLFDPLVSLIGVNADKIGTGADERFLGDRKQEAIGAGGVDSDGERPLADHRQDGKDLVAAEPRFNVGPDAQVGQWNGIPSTLGEVAHDGSREDIDEGVRTLRRGAGAVGDRERAANSAFEQSSRRFLVGIGKVRHKAVRFVEELSRNLGKIKEWAAKTVDQEIEKFKNEVNLPEFLRKQGYSTEKELGKAGLLLKHPDGERILVVTRGNQGFYYNVHDDTDLGSVIEFLMRKNGRDLRQVRQKLREWLNAFSVTWGIYEYIRPIASEPDRQKILLDLARMREGATNDSWMKKRKVKEKILADSRFSQKVLTDSCGNAVFQHFLNGQITGHEVDAGDPTGWSMKGEKGLWVSHGLGRGTTQITICQSGMDCLLHAQRNPDKDFGYVSIAGSLTNAQKADLGVIARMALMYRIKIVVALGADPFGETLVEELKVVFQKEGVVTTREIPENGKDCIENLQQQKETRACSMAAAKVG